MDIFLPVNIFSGLFCIGLFVVLSYLSEKIDLPGSIAGGFIAMGIFLGGGFMLLGLLLVFFVLGSLVSHWKKFEKQKLGLAQEDDGRRSVIHAVSNGGIAGICGLLAWLLPSHQDILVAMTAGSLAAATSDTLSSELGNVYGKRFFNILTLKTDTRGKDGVISLEGSLAGLTGSLVIALLFYVTHEYSWDACWVFTGGILGNITDSLLGAGPQKKGWLNNHQVNIGCTLTGALVSLIISIV